MTPLVVLMLVLDAVVLAALELLFLPLRVGAVPLPVSAAVAAVTTPWLVRAAARTGGDPLVATAPLVAWVVAVLGFGLGGPGGDVLLPGDWRSLLLLAGGMFAGAAALGRSLDPLAANALERRPEGRG